MFYNFLCIKNVFLFLLFLYMCKETLYNMRTLIIFTEALLKRSLFTFQGCSGNDFDFILKYEPYNIKDYSNKNFESFA